MSLFCCWCRFKTIPVMSLIVFSYLTIGTVHAELMQAEAGLQWRGFIQDPEQSHRTSNDYSISLALSGDINWNENKDQLVYRVFSRPLVEQDESREHTDMRELQWIHFADDWGLKIGLGKVFWGVVESQHLVDIINQTDTHESFFAEDKLGQALLQFNHESQIGNFEWYIMPRFNERDLGGIKSRLVDPDVTFQSAEYESRRGKKHTDYALRWGNWWDEFELYLSYFSGTNREPLFKMDLSSSNLIPYYQQVKRFGIESQWTGGEWIWKLEALYQQSNKENYFAAVVGFEKTWVGLNETRIDLGWLVEYHWVDSNNPNRYLFQSDIFVGTRLLFNDMASSDLLAGVVFDQKNGSQLFRVEGNTRVGDNMTVNLESVFFVNTDQQDLLYVMRNDDFLTISLNYFF